MNKAECEIRAKDLATKILRASANPLEMQYAMGQLVPLYEMIAETEAEVNFLEDDINRQKAKTEYEAERAGNIENDLDVAAAKLLTATDALRNAIAAWPQFDTEGDEVNGGDLVEWFAGWRVIAKAAVA